MLPVAEAGLTTVLRKPPLFPEQVWPLVYVVTVAVVFGFVYWVEGRDWSRLQKRLAEVAFALAFVVLLVNPWVSRGLLFGVIWDGTVALSYNLELVYAAVMTVTLGLLALFLYLTTRQRLAQGRG